MLKAIYCDDPKLIELLNQENGIVYSESQNSFLVDSKTFEVLDKKYLLTENDSGDINVFETLTEFFECVWEETTIPISLTFTYPDCIEIQLIDDIEIALQPYEAKNYPEQEESIAKLFKAKDWYKIIYNQIAQTMLQLVLDSITSEIKAEIYNLDEDE